MAQQKIGDYKIIEKLGSGAMGDVFKAQKTGSKDFVALKIMSEDLAMDKKHVARFQREIRHTIMLDHDHIVSTFAAGEVAGRPYCVMEYVQGITIKDFLRCIGAFDEHRAVEFATQIAEALKYANEFNGLIHRDVKPDNIIITNQKIAKLLDMGIAKTTESTTKVTQTGMVIGSPGYMSPEQVRGEENLDRRTDIFSLGATFYHMLVGSPPFEGVTPVEILTATVYNEPMPVHQKNPNVCEEVSAVVSKMLVKDREARYQNFEEVLQALRSLNISATPPKKSSPSTSTFQFGPSFVPTSLDLLMAQISLHNQLVSKKQIEVCLLHQENLALAGMALPLDSVLHRKKFLTPENRNTLNKAAEKYILNRGDELFTKVAQEKNLFSRWDIWENIPGRGKSAALKEKNILSEKVANQIFSAVLQMIEREEAKSILKLALEENVISREDAKTCSDLYSQNTQSGTYSSINEVLMQFLDVSTVRALHRAVRKSMILGQPPKTFLEELKDR